MLQYLKPYTEWSRSYSVTIPKHNIGFLTPSHIANFGGLGLLNVEIRAKACLIKSFMETAANPNFQENIYHAALFKYHVLEDRSLPDPGMPPYYPATFFNTIQTVSQSTPLNIMHISLKQWYRVLLEEKVTMREVDNTMEFIPCRVELQHPNNDWEVTWRRSRMSGLGSELSSFLFRILHQLLPTKERQHRVHPATASTCRLCQLNATEDLLHSFFHCPFNYDFGMIVVQKLDTGRITRSLIRSSSVL